ncbi:MAG: peptidase M24, structural domain-containing protein [Olpidium bornovanus]|uniref:Peptidase M24, structural domain-containing protein n=1 Tax=Olpidium bornovanus TaxID=278681 RepID=A0A8H7ZM79_9FUNG|nr:MAG: peptidase M24, structural domain-containing protein [Olpidium bornovanus]
MKATRPGVSESEVAARLQYECKMRGALDLAYIPVVAGGQNALCIHYDANAHASTQPPEILFIFCTVLIVFRDGDLVLVDAGALLYGYTSDVTRTWPVSGTFTEPQRKLYQAVLHVQKECIKVRKLPETKTCRMSQQEGSQAARLTASAPRFFCVPRLAALHGAKRALLEWYPRRIGPDVEEGTAEDRGRRD